MLLFLFLFPSKTFASERALVIKFATIAPDGSTWVKKMKDMDKRLREKSKGQLAFNLYPGGIAGDELDVLRKILSGQLHCSAFSGVGINQILPMARILDLPFLFRNDQEADQVRKELLDFFSEHFRQKGFELLAWAEIGNVYLFSKKPVHRVSNLIGLKIWSWSGDPVSKETFATMGTNPITLSVTDVMTALNTGMIDTFYAPPLGALSLQWHTQVKYMTSLPVANATGAILMSTKYFNLINKELSNLIKEELEYTMADLTSDMRKQATESIRLIRESGLEITPMPSGADLAAFYKIHDQVASDLSGQLYPKELLDRVYGILKKVR